MTVNWFLVLLLELLAFSVIRICIYLRTESIYIHFHLQTTAITYKYFCAKFRHASDCCLT